jgi:hypothetical protein
MPVLVRILGGFGLRNLFVVLFNNLEMSKIAAISEWRTSCHFEFKL